jgi:cell division transport system ATP-binding protein
MCSPKQKKFLEPFCRDLLANNCNYPVLILHHKLPHLFLLILRHHIKKDKMALDTIIDLDKIAVFQKNQLVLSNVSLQIERGEFCYLIGRTGSGKSSLMKILYADLPMTEGKARVAGFNLHELKDKQIPFLRRKIGIVFQDFQLLNDRSVRENLLFVMKATGWRDKIAMEERLEDVMEKVGLLTKGFKMPHQLSGGEQQRVVIGRALINDPDIILADEPTGNLDPETSLGIMELLRDISKTGRAILMATHDYTLFQKFPGRIFRCDAGKVIDLNPDLYQQVENGSGEEPDSGEVNG